MLCWKAHFTTKIQGILQHCCCGTCGVKSRVNSSRNSVQWGALVAQSLRLRLVRQSDLRLSSAQAVQLHCLCLNSELWILPIPNPGIEKSIPGLQFLHPLQLRGHSLLQAFSVCSCADITVITQLTPFLRAYCVLLCRVVLVIPPAAYWNLKVPFDVIILSFLSILFFVLSSDHEYDRCHVIWELWLFYFWLWHIQLMWIGNCYL